MIFFLFIPVYYETGLFLFSDNMYNGTVNENHNEKSQKYNVRILCNHEIVQSCSVPAEVRATAHNGHNRHTHTCIDTLRIFAYSIVINAKAYLFSRKVFALETFFPIAEAFQEKYEPDGSTYIKNKIAPKNNLQFSPLSLKSNGVVFKQF